MLPGLVLGFPPVRGGQWGEGCTRRPSGRSGGTHRHRRIGAGRAARDFSQPKPPPPPQTNHSAPPITPPTNMCHHGHRINFAVSLRSPTQDLEDGRRDSGLGGIRNIADVRGQPPPPPRSRPDARTRGLPGAEARPDPKGSGQPLSSRCSSPADEAATAHRPPPLRHQPGSSVAAH